MPPSNGRTITLGSRRFNVIWLNKAIHENIEPYPGDPKPEKKIFSDIKSSGYEHYIWTLGDHIFHPHADAPNHQNPEMNQKGIEVFGLDYFFNKACLIDLSKEESATTVDAIRYLKKVDRALLEPYADIILTRPAVIIRTGFDFWIEQNRPLKLGTLPYLTPQAADFIIQNPNLKVIAMDSPTIDPDGSHYAHQCFKHQLIVESMVNLHAVPEHARLDFDLQTATIPIEGATGGPVCAFAFIEIESLDEEKEP